MIVEVFWAPYLPLSISFSVCHRIEIHSEFLKHLPQFLYNLSCANTLCIIDQVTEMNIIHIQSEPLCDNFKADVFTNCAGLFLSPLRTMSALWGKGVTYSEDSTVKLYQCPGLVKPVICGSFKRFGYSAVLCLVPRVHQAISCPSNHLLFLFYTLR